MDFKITSSTLNSSYNYEDVIIVQGNFVKDATTNDLTSINGQCYRINASGQQGDYIGSFNGYPQSDGEIYYDLSKMNRSDSNLVWDAIDDIEPKILGENSED